jgi:uncharacterized protein YecE (DUF72 family)
VTQQSFGFEESVPQPARAVPLGPSRVFVGTCGYSYRDWIGPFYPLGTKSNGMLPYYATRFPAVEIDATYYRIPGAATFASMDARTPPEFRFSVKLPSTLTHLPADAAPVVSDDARIFREFISRGRTRRGLPARLERRVRRLAARRRIPQPRMADARNVEAARRAGGGVV